MLCIGLILALFSTSLSAESFAGRVTANKVRVRLEASLEGAIYREAEAEELFVVLGEENDFYIVLPPPDLRAFVYRSFIKQGVVEGTNVNIRLRPDLDSPIIAQLNSGDKVSILSDQEAGKWLEIGPPQSVQLYISRDYVENAGDQELVQAQGRRRREVSLLLSSAYLLSQSELDKPFEEINFDTLTAGFNKVIEQYSELIDDVRKAEEARTLVQDAYLEKKIAFLEAKASNSSQKWEEQQAQLNDVVRSYQEKLSEMESQIFDGPEVASEEGESALPSDELYGVWHPLEKSQFRKWQRANSNSSITDFYTKESIEAQTLTGILQPYTQPVKNRPGDYLLVNSISNLPIAYLYSTKVDLKEQVGREITLKGSARPNNHFAFPAFHVLSLE